AFDLTSAQAVNPSLEGQVLPAGRGGIEARPLWHVSDYSPHARSVSAHVEPGHRGGAGVGRGQGRQDLDGRGLARPVGAEQAEDSAGRYSEAHSVQRTNGLVAGAVRLGEVADLDGICGHGYPFRSVKGPMPRS